jgi:hypothetical protein
MKKANMLWKRVEEGKPLGDDHPMIISVAESRAYAIATTCPGPRLDLRRSLFL